jgi:hypothetical protein
LFGMSTPGSARDNIVKPFQIAGIIDEDGNLTELGQLWRNDDTYAEACERILREAYPEEIQHLGDTAAVERWFTGHGFGASNARQMTATFRLLSEPLPDELPVRAGAKNDKGRSERRTNSKTTAATPLRVKASVKPAEKAEPVQQGSPSGNAPLQQPPTLQMNLQIHLPLDATPEQIDIIFASMAKHLYNK